MFFFVKNVDYIIIIEKKKQLKTLNKIVSRFIKMNI